MELANNKRHVSSHSFGDSDSGLGFLAVATIKSDTREKCRKHKQRPLPICECVCVCVYEREKENKLTLEFFYLFLFVDFVTT